MDPNDNESILPPPHFRRDNAQVIAPDLISNPSIVKVSDFGITEKNGQLGVERAIARGSNDYMQQAPARENTAPLYGRVGTRQNLIDDQDYTPSEQANQQNNDSQSPGSFLRRLAKEIRQRDSNNPQSRG